MKSAFALPAMASASHTGLQARGHRWSWLVWLSNLHFDPTLPGYKHWLEGLSKHHTLIWADLRGGGMSDRDVPSMTFDDLVGDLESMVDDVGLARFALMGLSHAGATAIAYAARHPQQVSHLVLHAPVARGLDTHELSPKGRAKVDAHMQLLREQWDAPTPKMRRFFAEFVEFAPSEMVDAFDVV